MIKSGKLLKIHEKDNVAVLLDHLKAGEVTTLGTDEVEVKEDIKKGHKISIEEIAQGENIIKYGFPIGHALKHISAGEYVHTHNIKTNLKGMVEYAYKPQLSETHECQKGKFMGYLREDGSVGIRNEIWIVNTVGCINKTAERLAHEANQRFHGKTEGVFSFSHPYGCSQLGEDHETTQKILADMVKHLTQQACLYWALVAKTIISMNLKRC
jgi:altronate hydrolase